MNGVNLKVVILSTNDNKTNGENRYNTFLIKRIETTKIYQYEQNKSYANHQKSLSGFTQMKIGRK